MKVILSFLLEEGDRTLPINCNLGKKPLTIVVKSTQK